MSILLTMEILRVASLLLLFCFYSIFCFPSRPLNERSTELAWQAWLLVDDQNQNKHYDSDSFTRRRITPKSVFIAPTFSPESLPACADGYRPDSMGRCIKIIKLDEEAHLDFLLEKLNAQFGNYDELEDESQEDLPTAGPFQLNIPLGGATQEQPTDHHHGNLDIAIVVAPTNGNFGLEDTMKSTVKKTNLLNENSQKTLDDQQFYNSTNINSKRKTENVFPIAEQVEITTVNAAETISLLDVETLSTKEEIEESTSPLPTSQTAAVETTTPDIETDTTISYQHALFFLKPSLSNTKHVQNGTNNAEGTPMITSSHDSIVISNHSLTTLLSNSTLVVNTSSKLTSNQPVVVALKSEQEHFTDPDTLGAHLMSSDDLMASEDFHRKSTEFVRFPTSQEEAMPHTDHIKYPEKVTQNQPLAQKNTDIYASQYQHTLASPSNISPNSGYTLQNSGFVHTHNGQKMQSSEQFGTLFHEYIHSRGADLKGNERFVFKNRDPVTEVTLPDNLESDLKSGFHKVHANYDRFHSNGGYDAVSDQMFNHRNRDKHSNLWSLPPSWIESSPQKPIVLRFSRRSGSSRHLLEEHLLPHTQNAQAFYREVPSEDFSYIFGVKQNHNRRKHR